MQTVVVHVEHAYLIRGAKAVLYRPQYAVGKLLFALEIQHRVNDVFHYLRSRDAAVLVDVAHYEYRYLLGFREVHERIGAFPHLHDTSCRRTYRG